MHQIVADERRPTILIVEDNDLILSMATDAIEAAGFDAIGVAAAEDALGLAVTNVAFDAVFTDIDLAGPLDGWELAETLREMRPGLPVVYTSGKPADAARFVPDSTFVAKPYGIPDLCALMLRLVAARAAAAPAYAPAFTEPRPRPELRLIA